MEGIGQNHTTAILPPGKIPHFLLNMSLRGPQNKNGNFGKRQILASAGIRTSNHVARRIDSPRSFGTLFLSKIKQNFVLLLYSLCYIEW